MKGVVEDDNSRTSCGIANDLNRVFHSLGATVKKESLFGKTARGYLYDAFCQCYVWFIHHHTKAGMCESSSLFRNGPGHLWTCMANIHGTNAASKVDIAVTVYIFNHSSVSFSREYVHRGTNTACHKLLAPCQKLLRF